MSRHGYPDCYLDGVILDVVPEENYFLIKCTYDSLFDSKENKEIISKLSAGFFLSSFTRTGRTLKMPIVSDSGDFEDRIVVIKPSSSRNGLDPVTRYLMKNGNKSSKIGSASIKMIVFTVKE
jgi:hypothetical protein